MIEQVRTSELGEHRLIIESLKDGKAHCQCGGWYFSQTGHTYIEDIFEQFSEHSELKQIPVFQNKKEEV